MGVAAPRVVLAAHDDIEWRTQLFDFENRVGLCGIRLFNYKGRDSFYRDGELRMKRTAVAFDVPVMVHADGVRGKEGTIAACADQIARAKLQIIEQFRTGVGVVYDDDILEGHEIQLKD